MIKMSYYQKNDENEISTYLDQNSLKDQFSFKSKIYEEEVKSCYVEII